jgi:ferric-dicitrate binding protein FerR (iron transport regulator)
MRGFNQPMDLRLEEIRELCRQFSALHDGQLSAAEIADLEQKLRDNPASRRLYVRYSRVCAGLSWDTAHATDPLAADETNPAGAPASRKRSGAIAYVTDLSQSIFGTLHRPSVFSLGIVGLFGAAVGAGLLFALMSRNPDGQPQPTSLTETASVTEVRSLKLASGTATLSLANIGHVVVEGPAEFELLGQKRARLTYGRIKMRVTEESGRGFVVETPGGEVIDLGTEFGLDVDRGGKTSLAVFEGMVDLRMPTIDSADDQVERFELGEGAVIDDQGEWQRLMSIVRGDDGTFLQDSDASGIGSAIISKVTDNLQKEDTKKFYQIVPRGLQEDALCYVDRLETQWNGVSGDGIPSYLLGADYVKTFNSDKRRKDVRIKVTLSQPARLFVFFDDRLEVPTWLKKQGFRPTNDKIGSDFGPYGVNSYNYAAAVGAGNSIDATFTIWEKTVTRAGTVALGHNPGQDVHSSSMYGIAAVPLEHPKAVTEPTAEAKEAL